MGRVVMIVSDLMGEAAGFETTEPPLASSAEWHSGQGFGVGVESPLNQTGSLNSPQTMP